jgi:hypothetical protein
MVDLAVQSTTGVKAGFSETLEAQLQKILQTAATALSEADLSSRHKTDPDASLPADSYLEAHPEKRAVVVIDNFLHKSDGNTIVYDKIAEWAATLVESNVAHVIFLTSDTSYSKSLSKSLPDRVFRQAALGDLSPDVAKRFILSHIQDDSQNHRVARKARDRPDEKGQVAKNFNLAELDESIGVLGGRLTDLEFLARRIKAGQSPKFAVAEITEQSASEILKMFLLPGKSSSDYDNHKWSVEQAWYLVKALASSESLRYNEVLLHKTFASSLSAPDGASALEGLTNAELVTLRTERGRPSSLSVGKPVYQAAFRMLTSDTAFCAKMDLAVATELAKIEAKTIDKAEDELVRLGALPNQPRQISGRVLYLLDKVQKSQGTIEDLERDMAKLKKVLAKEY